MALKSFLQGTTLADVFQQAQGVISFDHDTTIGRALEVLGCYQVLSAPVVVRPDSQPPRQHAPDPQQLTPVKAMLGFVGVGDILEKLLQGVQQQGTFQLTPEAIEALGVQLCDQPVVTLFGPEVHGCSSEVLSLVDSCRDWGLKGNVREPLLSIIRAGFLCAQEVTSPAQHSVHSRVVHRLAVFDCAETNGVATPYLKGIFSQSDLVRLVAGHVTDLLGHLGKRSLQELGLVQGQVVVEAGGGWRPGGRSGPPHSVVYPHGADSPGGALHRVVCVQQHTQALEAFHAMYRERVSGVGVVAADGRLVGNLSASDLRCLAPGLFSALLLPVDQFLAKRPLLEAVQQEAAMAFSSSSDPAPMDTDSAATRAAPGGAVDYSLWLRGRSLHYPPLITCQAMSTFSQVVQLLAKHSLHRIYVVDPDQKPVGVVTLTDVLRTLSQACE